MLAAVAGVTRVIIPRRKALSEWNAVEARYDEKRGLKPGRRLGCQAKVQGEIVIDVPPESQVHRQVVRKAASASFARCNAPLRASASPLSCRNRKSPGSSTRAFCIVL